jgi:hypothetical protein
MFGHINQFIINCSQSWWKFLLIFLGQTGTMQVLMRITGEFPSVTAGDVPFDMQNTLKPDQVFIQLEGYTERAFDLYMIFQATDYLFPLFAGLLLATVCAFSLRHLAPGFYSTAVARNLFVLLLIPTAFDWLENINLLWAVTAWPEPAHVAANLAVAAKMGKLTTMGIAFLITGVLLIGAAGNWLIQRIRGSQ